MNRTIAFLACAGTITQSPTRRADAFEHDHQLAALREGLAGSGVTLVEVDWRDDPARFAGFDLVLIGTPWDYAGDKDAFLDRLGAIAAMGVPLCNPLELVRWNADKRYLRDLAARGVATIPTLWAETASATDIAAAFDHFGCDRVVAKRRVGAGAVGQALFSRDDPGLAGWRMDWPAMIQPFLPAIAEEGEFSFVFVDGGLSHTLIKRARSGDYRIQSVYGGHESAVVPSAADRAAAQGVMARLPDVPLYARIDMVRLPEGHLALMEAELIEPYLFPQQGPDFSRLMGEALLRRLPPGTGGAMSGAPLAAP